MRNKLLFSAVIFALCFLGSLNASAQWMSMTSRISDPSFESGKAEEDLTTVSYADGYLTGNSGWYVSAPGANWETSQYGKASSKTKIQGIGTAFDPSEGGKYFYLRYNWNSNATYSISQTIASNNNNLPAGYYRLSCKTANFPANPSPVWTLSLSDGSNTAVTHDAQNRAWHDWAVILYKNSSTTSLTISASLIFTGLDNGGRHFSMLLDDFQLEYLEPEEGWNVVTSSLPTNVNDYFYTFTDANKRTLTQDVGNHQGSDSKTLWYRDDINAETNKDALMTIATDGNYQIVACANYPDYMLQTEQDNSWLYHTKESIGIAWGHTTFSFTNGNWIVQNGYYPDNRYWGTWRDSGGNSIAGDEIAANKSDANRSNYLVSSIKRGQYLQKVLVDNLNESTDVTYVITNPGAEYGGTAGWTVENGLQAQANDAFSGRVGKCYFERWQNPNNGNLNNCSMYQELTDMKGGDYTISVKTGITATGAYLFANDQQVDLSTKDGDGRVSVLVHVNDGGSLRFGVKLDNYQTNWVYFDDFKMTFSSTTSFLYNLGAENFMARGADWGTRAVTDRYGLPVEIVKNANNTVSLRFIDTGGYLFVDRYNNLFTDNNQNSPAEFTMTQTTVDGKTVCQFQHTNGYLSTVNGNLVFSSSSSSASQWQLMSANERNEIVDRYPADNFETVMNQARTRADNNDYTTFPPEHYVSSEMAYWIKANYQAVDMTSSIINPSFADGNDNGWSYTNERTDVYKYFSDGIVEQWQTPGTWTQTISGLQEGIYKLSVNAFERHGSIANDKRLAPYGNIGSAYMSAGGQQVHLAAWHEEYTGENNPNDKPQASAKFSSGSYANELYFYVNSGDNVTITISMPGYLGAEEWMAMDNFTLTRYVQDSRVIVQPETDWYYLRNVGTGEYLTFDGYWGTYYSMSDVGKLLHLVPSTNNEQTDLNEADGTMLMHTTYLSKTDDVDSSTDTENYFYSHLGRKEHAFSNGNSHEGGEKWVFYQVGERDGKPVYNIMNFMTDYYLSGEEGSDNTNISPGWGGKLKPTADANDQTVQWQLVKKSDLLAELQSIGNNESKDASFLIDEPDFIVGYNNVYEEFYKWKVMGNDQFKYSDWTDTNIISFYSQPNGVSTGNVAYAFSLASDYPDILQTIEDIPNGLYVVECQAVFRDGDEGAQSDNPSTANVTSSSRKHADRLADGTYVNRAYLYANANMVTPPDDARDLIDRYWIYENAQMMPVKVAPAELFPAQDGKSYQNPALLTAFQSEGYTVQLPVYVNNGKLTIGLVQLIGINNNLLAFDRFRLKYYGENYTGDEVKTIAKNNLERLQNEHNSYQSNAITTPEMTKLNNDATAIASESNSDYNTAAKVAKYNQAARDYGETSINWYIYNVLQTDYDRGDYKTVDYDGTRAIDIRNGILYPFVDEKSKENVVKYFGAGTDTNNEKGYEADGTTHKTYTADTNFGSRENMWTHGRLDDLKDAISALRTYVAANSEVRYLENGLSDDEALVEREMRLAMRPGTAEAVVVPTGDGGVRRVYEINPVMFANTGASVTAPPVNKIMTNARCWALRDAYHHRFYDYTNYYWYGTEAGTPKENHVVIEGLMTGKYLVTISESHNQELGSLEFNYKVGGNFKYPSNVQLFRSDASVWQAYTHSWQDISAEVNITEPFQTVELFFIGGDESQGGATMNICNLRIYRMDDVQTLLLDENEPVLAKNGMPATEIGADNRGYRGVKTYFKRTMAKNQWNTLVLPVNLTKQQVVAAFGKGTILATMNGFATDYPAETQKPDNCIHFTTDDMSDLNDSETAITEGKVYLIRPTADPAVPVGEKVHFKNSYENRPNYKEIEGPIYYISYVDYDVTEGETNPATGDKKAHTAPTGGLAYQATGVQKDKLTLQMQGSYGKTLVRVNQQDGNGGTNYIYAFQQQSDGAVRLVELEDENTYNETDHGIAGTGRLFKGYRGWAVANYKTGADVRQTYTVLLDEGDNELTIIRGIDSEEGYSEVKIPRQGIYDLQGRRIDRKEFYSGSYPQGVYIVDGKKVVRK